MRRMEYYARKVTPLFIALSLVAVILALHRKEYLDAAFFGIQMFTMGLFLAVYKPAAAAIPVPKDWVVAASQEREPGLHLKVDDDKPF